MMRRSWCLLPGVCFVVVGLALGMDALQTRHYNGLAYTRETKKGSELWLRRSLNRHVNLSKRYGVEAIYDSSLAWSPNGQDLAYTGRFGLEERYVFVLAVRTGQLAEYASPAGCYPESLTWSLDGQALLFWCRANEHDGAIIWHLDVGSGELAKTLYLAPGSMGLAWSPDRTHAVVSIQDSQAGDRIAIISLDGSDEEVIHDRLAHSRMAWSPAGRFIAFVASHPAAVLPATECLYLYDIDLDALRCLAHSAAQPVWNNAGTALTHLYRDSDGNRWIANLDPFSGEQHPLLPVHKGWLGPDWGVGVRLVTWSEDDRFLAYVWCAMSENRDSCAIRIMNHDGSSDRAMRLVRNRGENNPAWRP